MYDGHLSPVRPVQFGVPRGSVLGPLLFVLYTAEIRDVVANHGFCFHQYADDLHVYVACPITDSSVVAQRLSRCLCDVYIGGKVRVSEFMIFLDLQHCGSK